MFRKGGGVNMNGIMSGITDREMHAESNPDGVGFTSFTPRTEEELTKIYTERLKESAPPRDYDPLTTFLLQYGPALASARPSGGFLATAVGAAGKPIESMLEEKAAQRK